MTVATDWLIEHQKELKQRKHGEWHYSLIEGTWMVSCMCGYWYTEVNTKEECLPEYNKHIEYSLIELIVIKTTLKSVEHMLITN